MQGGPVFHSREGRASHRPQPRVSIPLMDDLVTLHPNGLFLRGEAIARGYSDRDLARACVNHDLVRVRQGTYAPSASWPQDPYDQHLLRAQGVTLRHPQRIALSHTTGAVAHGLRLWDPDLSAVHVTRLAGGNGRAESDVRYHRHRPDIDSMVQLDEMLVVDVVRCALGAASLTSIEAGVVLLDSMLEQDVGHGTTMFEMYSGMTRSPFTRRLKVSTRLARRGSQSVGESRTRFLFWEQHLPEPVLQFEIYDGNRLVGICDYAWPDLGLLGEFDGQVKYRRFMRPGEDPSQVVFREKRREDTMREITGWPMIRYVYADLYARARTAERTRRLMDRSTGARSHFL
jgi:hypothetical protein